MTTPINPLHCDHQWQRVHEQAIFGGTFPTGYRCKVCLQFIPLDRMTPEGLTGTNTGEEVLVGPHGGNGQLSDGTPYREQVIYPGGRAEIIRPLGWERAQ